MGDQYRWVMPYRRLISCKSSKICTVVWGSSAEVAFIAQKDRRVGGQRPGNTDPLLLSARQLIRVAVDFVAQIDERQQFRHPRLDKGLVAPPVK